MPPSIDVTAAIDEGPWSGYQKLIIGATALAVVVDGVDNQLLPNAVPALMREWNLPRAAFATASAAAPVGMIVGGMLGGVVGDRIGRRTGLVASVVWFTVFTLAIAFVDTLAWLAAIRLVAGIGLGAAMPNAAALASEYVPRRQRPMAVTLAIVCVPLGGSIAGLLSGVVVPAYGHRALFVAGGLAPLALAIVLAAVLPESPQYLVGRRERWPEVVTFLRRIGRPVPATAEFVDAITTRTARHSSDASWRTLFSPDLRRDTLALMGAFSSCLLAIFMGFLWIPAMLADPSVGFAQREASYALSLFNFGGGGALGGALLIQRVGSKPALPALSALGAGAALAMAGLPLDPGAPFAALTMFALTGALLNAVQATMYSLAAHVYPTAIRAVGVGTTVAVGRVGNMMASYVGSWALSAGGPPLYFSTWAAAMTMVFISLALVGRHIPSSRPRRSRATP